MTPVGHRIALVLQSIRKGEPGFGWVAAWGSRTASEVGVEAGASPFASQASLSSHCHGKTCP